MGLIVSTAGAGLYGIEATQTVIAANNPNLVITNHKVTKNPTTGNLDPVLPNPIPQNFMVVAPQFSLDPKLINSYYPPSTHQDEGHILPHIVFNDAHVPWFRTAGHADYLLKPQDPDNDGHTRNFVPWMALVVLDPDELVVNADDAKSTGLDQLAPPKYDPTKPPADGAYKVTVGDYLGLTSRIYYETGYDTTKQDWKDLKTSKDMTSVIFPTKARIQQIFGDNSGIDSDKGVQKTLAAQKV
jgi:hypothetical protein